MKCMVETFNKFDMTCTINLYDFVSIMFVYCFVFQKPLTLYGK